MMHLLSRSSRLGRAIIGGLGLIVASTLGGCVGQGEYDRLYETNNSLTARNAELTRLLEESRTENEMFRKGLGRGEGTLADLTKQNAELRRLLDQAMADYTSLESRLAGLEFGPLDAATDRALTALAAQHPDLIKYDSARGMLRFAADLTFDSGSDVVREDARSALAALAQVLVTPSASGYTIVIEGHTDSQRLSANTAQRHRTNRHLSTHRAISVIDSLAGMSVPYDRMMAAGWGEHRPLIPNSGNGNTPQNRRVEIFLARNHSTGGTTETTATPDQTTPPERPVDITK
jgi:chemotaxis protein MotB